jgi:predicted transglutaminase-like protease
MFLVWRAGECNKCKNFQKWIKQFTKEKIKESYFAKSIPRCKNDSYLQYSFKVKVKTIMVTTNPNDNLPATETTTNPEEKFSSGFVSYCQETR